MTLGDKPNLSTHAHPITSKVWMTKKRIRKFFISPLRNGGEVEIFEDGTVIIFDESGNRVSSEKFKNQDSAIDFLKTYGWKLGKRI